MVSIKQYIFLLFLLVLTACGKNEFTLQFNMSDPVTENYNVTYYATDNEGGRTIQAVASLREGKCELLGVTKKPTLMYVTKRASLLPLLIYAERGEKIEISGQSDDPLLWHVGGNKINETLSGWRLQNDSILGESDPERVNEAVKRYVEENQENPVSTVLMLCYYDRKMDERGYVSLMSVLRGEAKNPEWLNIIGRSDQLNHSYSYPARLESISLRSVNKGGDTLFTDKSHPVMMLFWEIGYADRKNMIDSIKAMEKEYPDSARIIADVCLDVDSVGWRNAIRKDSLYEEMKRFWVPTGMTDPKINKLKVTALPYFIVFDKEGKQQYRGKDLSDAMEEYRKLFHLSDTTQN